MSGGVLTLARNAGVIRGVAAAPGGFVITGSEDKTFSIYRGNELMHSIKHSDVVTAVAVSPDGAHFFSAAGGTIKQWSLYGAHHGARPWLSNLINAGMYTSITTIVALSDGVRLVLGTLDGDIMLYSLNGTRIHTFSGHTGSLVGLAATRDDQHIISGSTQDKRVKVWSVASRSLLSTCMGHTSGMNAVAAMPDGQRFLTGSGDKTIRVWLLDGTHQNTFRLDGHLETPDVNALVALADNQHALAGATDKTVKLFNVDNGAVLRTFKHHTSNVNMNCLALLPDGLRFVSGSDDRTVCIVYHGLTPQ